MARLSKDQWEDAKVRWESDHNLTYEALANEIGVSKPAVIGYAKRNGWSRENVSGNKSNVSKDVTGNISKGNKSTSRKIAKTSIKSLKKQPSTEIVPVDEVPVQPRPQGRPTLYKSEYDEQVHRLCLLGLTDIEIADFYDVSEQTINAWKNNYPSFLEAMRSGKVDADSRVTRALYKSAVGEHFVEEERPVSDGNGGTEIITVKKQVPPNYQAQSLWLRNRRPKDWKERVDIKEESIVRIIPWDDLRQISQQALDYADQQHRSIIEGRAERLGITADYSSEFE
jgi:hypothetical protein